EPRSSIHAGLPAIRGLSDLLRASDWKVTLTLAKKLDDLIELVNVEPGDTSGRNFGVCFDIGTTTVSAQIIDLNTKKVLGTKATYNKQSAFGSDVITRIIYARNKDGLDELHRAVVDDMNEIIREFIKEQAIDLNDVTCILCSGNTTMMHLLLRVDPTYIRKEPYTPVFNSVGILRAAEAGIMINPKGLLACAPGVASYVGGDVTAGVLSSGQYQEEGITVLIDIGTNGEIVLGNREFLVCAAASAGPAFEGSGVSCGMRAAKGAIQKVSIRPRDFSCSVSVIGDALSAGICGSGYIDAIAQMLAAGALDKDGKIRDIKSERIRKGEFGREFILVFAKESATASDIVITEADIENLKRAKAAIYSAISVLVRHLDLDFSRVDKVFIAGGFGTYLNMENAVRIGLLPDLPREKFLFIGNSSLSGSRQMLLSWDAMRRADEIARRMNYVELSVEPGYMEEYMAALFFPHTDLGLFPTVSSGRK
ncbi:MAG: ASKHA domain-containing protein, partial [Candidatus Omnitrophica bacterium]|nr:ASKHA domain-containing protein [Candidatus Omnitrophota bacterium]